MGVFKDVFEILFDLLKKAYKNIRKKTTDDCAAKLIGRITRELLEKDPDMDLIESLFEELEDYEPTASELRTVNRCLERIKAFQQTQHPRQTKIVKAAKAAKPVAKRAVKTTKALAVVKAAKVAKPVTKRTVRAAKKVVVKGARSRKNSNVR